MPETAEAHSSALTTNRNCTIEITNVSHNYCLIKPKVHMESGFPFSPPQPTVQKDKTEVCSFTKDDNTASGAVGVLTYELFHMSKGPCNEIMAVMFSVPFDYNFYTNWLGVGVFANSVQCDGALFKSMYNDDEKNFTRHKSDGSGVKYDSHRVQVRATMSDEGKAIIKLELYEN